MTAFIRLWYRPINYSDWDSDLKRKTDFNHRPHENNQLKHGEQVFSMELEGKSNAAITSCTQQLLIDHFCVLKTSSMIGMRYASVEFYRSKLIKKENDIYYF